MRHLTLPKPIAALVGLVMVWSSMSGANVALAGAVIDPAIARQFDYLSTNGNSNCSQAFLDSIAKMPVVTLLQGSCCSPMALERYAEQLQGLKKYKEIAAIPPDPYNIEAGLAQRALAHYDLALSPGEQAAYNYAMNHSAEHGPCCCKCWRWHIYGGLAKFLIRHDGFSGQQITEIWNLSDGCGGSA